MARWEQSVTTIVDFASFEAAMRDAASKWSRRPLWRGHGNANWTLKPRVFRDVIGADGLKARFHESGLLWAFMLRGVPRTLNPPSHEDHVGWMFLGQHYGLPTRVLDWTQAPLVALYFAVEDTAFDSVDGCVWALDAQELNSEVASVKFIIESGQAAVKMMADAALGSGVVPTHSVLAIAPRENDLRMLVQQSQFSIHRDDTDLADLPGPATILRKFIVPGRSKASVRAWLAWAGISRATLFPDLASLATELRGNAVEPVPHPAIPEP